VPLEVASGTEVITQGDVGDRFYIITDGAVEIIEDGVLRRRQGAGESFGEIALLHDVKRTATVRAQVPTHLFALDRDPFLLSVTGHDVSLEVADAFLGSSGSAS
jgi:CRP-like cAMP-binding protein